METSTPWPKTCGCGEVWSCDHWPELPLVGRYLAGRDGWIELRSCVCGKTLIVPASDLAHANGAPPS
jgi:hypothetical protein